MQVFAFSKVFRNLLLFIFINAITAVCAVGSASAFAAVQSTTNVPANTPTSTLVVSDKVAKTKAMVGQKIILDFRYFCHNGTASKACRTPMTSIPDVLLQVLSRNNIGGVILFAENIESAPQLITLNHTMQQHMTQRGKAPLFIAVDQEGGRVSRLPYSMLAPFAGNMAIGASFHKHGTAFSTNVAEHIGQTLLPLGINTNFAPSVDVNSEPKNPVINVRSFSQYPQQVAALGEAFVSAMQRSGVISAIKHFPGHGDTHVDSHSGLPNVAHSKTHALATDILPFANIINSNTPPAMIMSAHIQYPSLDSSTLIDKNGNAQIVPATLSKRILTDLLRTQLGYQGLVVTDALDMAGIAQFFTPEDAMVNAFKAGADIALMPFTIRTPNDIANFEKLLHNVSSAVVKDEQLYAKVQRSNNRIASAKQQFELHKFVAKPASWWLSEAAEINDKQHGNGMMKKGVQLQKALSEAAVTVLHGKEDLPVRAMRYVAFMPDSARCLALEHALSASAKKAFSDMKAFSDTTAVSKQNVQPNKSLQYVCLPLLTLPKQALVKRLINDTDAIIVGDISPRHANYELGGLDNADVMKQRAPLSTIHAFMKDVMHYAKGQGKRVVFAPMRMPYVAQEMAEVSDIIIATFSYVVNVNPDKDAAVKATSHVLQAFTDVLMGNTEAHGRSPVNVNIKPNRSLLKEGH
ncbi:glycoside hydrolase family 3 protein [Alteromonas sp. MTD1]|uniref:glycoside hydrolase family 3 N-terminal domain-containing protein n=1 Tax=Alteromonas sp. MTD1 TaxID=3057962 RepID=UPI0036F4460F